MRILVIFCIIWFCFLATICQAWPWSRKTTAPQAEVKIRREYKGGHLAREDIEKKATGSASQGIPDFKAGAMTLTENEIEIGGVSVKYKLPFKADRGLLWAGVGLMVLGVLVFGWICKAWILAGLSGLLGVSVIGLAYHPWIAGIVAGVAVLAGVAYLFYALRRKYVAESTNALLMAAISESPDDTEKEVRARAVEKAERHAAHVEKEIKRLDRKRHK